MIKFKDINYPRRKEKEVINIYDSTIRAAIAVSGKIYNCLYGKSKTCGGYEWIKR